MTDNPRDYTEILEVVRLTAALAVAVRALDMRTANIEYQHHLADIRRGQKKAAAKPTSGQRAGPRS